MSVELERGSCYTPAPDTRIRTLHSSHEGTVLKNWSKSSEMFVKFSDFSIQGFKLLPASRSLFAERMRATYPCLGQHSRARQEVLTGYSAWQILCKMRMNKGQTKLRRAQLGQLPINYCPGSATIPNISAQLSAFHSTRIYFLVSLKSASWSKLPILLSPACKHSTQAKNPPGVQLGWKCKSQQNSFHCKLPSQS